MSDILILITFFNPLANSQYKTIILAYDVLNINIYLYSSSNTGSILIFFVFSSIPQKVNSDS